MVSIAADSAVVWNVISFMIRAWQQRCYFVPTQGPWQRQHYVVPTFSNIPDNQNRKPNSSMENPMMASTATGRAVVTKEHTMAFMAHPMATNRTVVNKDTTSAKNPNSNSNAVKNEHKTIANPMLPSTTVTNSTVVWNSISLKALCCQRQYYVVPTVNNAPSSLDGRPDSSTANPMIISTATNSAVAIVTEGNASAKNRTAICIQLKVEVRSLLNTSSQFVVRKHMCNIYKKVC